jgi:hypothetical protein
MRSAVMLRRVVMGLALDPTMLETFVTAAPGPDPDPSIVEGLYRDRGRQLWAFGRRLGLAPDECDDAVQEAHLRLWSSLASGARIDDHAAWLYRVFYRIAMDRHRLSRRIRDLLQRWPGREWSVPAVGAADGSTDAAVWQPSTICRRASERPSTSTTGPTSPSIGWRRSWGSRPARLGPTRAAGSRPSGGTWQ